MTDARPNPPSARFSRVALIVNTHSRRGGKLFEQARDLLTANGIDLATAAGVSRPDKMQAAVKQAVADGADLIIVGGGDGSIASTIGLLRGSDATFAALPLGTANSFARALGIGADLESAVATIAAGHSVPIDLAEINGHMFANSAAMGIPPLIGDTIPHWLKRWFGRIGYLAWAVRTFVRFRPFRVTVTTPQGAREHWATEVRLLNGQFTGGIKMSEEASFDSGTLMVQLVTGLSRWRLARNWLRKMAGSSVRDPEVLQFAARELTIAARPRQRISLDGEVLTRTPAKVSVHPQAVRVVAPPQEPIGIDAT